jgi:aspartate/methionine/tyrosine aminotransferase
LFFDEHYRFLPLEDGTRLIASGYDICKKIHRKTYASGSMCKCFGITGIRIGFLIGEPKLLAKCRDYKDYVTHTIPSITDKIAYLALKNKNKIIKMRKKHILRNIQLLNRFMETNTDFFDYVKPTGGVVCFPRLKFIDDVKFCNDLFEKYGVSLLPGYGFEIKGHFRLNFGINTNEFERALNKIQKYVNKLKN